MDGILNINKPAGPTSFDIVSRIKRLTGEKRVGHAGTLDPAASGVLPVCLGRGTRIIEYIMDSPKIYRAEIEFGKTTDTCDSEGEIIFAGDASRLNRDLIQTALADFTGEIEQVPPVYSALKYRGEPYYKLARAGVQVEMKSRTVAVHSIEIIDWRPPAATLDITCGKGTYIRSLARDLGQKLGCGAYLKSLVRRKCGPFRLEDALTPDELEQAFGNECWHRYIYPPDSVLLHMEAVTAGDETCRDIMNGRTVALETVGISTPQETRCRVYTPDGRFLGILRYIGENECWQPEKVFLRENRENTGKSEDEA